MSADHSDSKSREKFRELSAVDETGALTLEESMELSAHLTTCEECREIARQYHVLATEGMLALVATYRQNQETKSNSAHPQ